MNRKSISLLSFVFATSAFITFNAFAKSSSFTELPGQRIEARGAFSCDFSVDLTQVTEPLGATLERDRIFSQRYVQENTYPNNPGMLQKHLPILQTSPTTAIGGGRYLFQSRIQAKQYETFITQLFTYPGTTQFLSRPEFSNTECRDWTVIRAWNFEPIEQHVAFRTERFDTGLTNFGAEIILAARLHLNAKNLLEEAHNRGYAEVQILHNKVDHKVQLVYMISRMSEPSPTAPDVVAFQTLATANPLGDTLPTQLNLTRVFDLTTFVLNTWLPYQSGDQGNASLWPNSPPFPMGFCGDNVCVPGQGENNSNCPIDCSSQCGNAVCDAGENLNQCPSDCELPLAKILNPN